MDFPDTEQDPSPHDTTVRLLQRIRGGDSAARELLAARYLTRLKQVARGRVPPALRSVIDTNDLVQITLIRALDKVESFEPKGQGSFLRYLRTILWNRIRDEVRRVRTHEAAMALEPLEPARLRDPLEEAIGAEELELYETALDRLPPEQAEAVVMRIEMEFSYAEIATAMGKPSANAARMMVSRALVRLAEEIKRSGGSR